MGSGIPTNMILLTWTLSLLQIDARELTIGCLFQTNSSEKTYLEKIAHLALRENNHIVSQHNYSVKFIFKDSGCSPTQAIGMASNLLLRHNVSAIIGPNCNKACESVANIARFYNTPMVSYGCNGHVLRQGPTYIRLVPYLMHHLHTIAEQYSRFINVNCVWKSFTVVYSDIEPWKSFTKILVTEFKRLGDSRDERTSVKTYRVQRYTVDELTNMLKMNSRVILFACDDSTVTEYLHHFTRTNSDMLCTNKYALLTIGYRYDNQPINAFTRHMTNNKRCGYHYVNVTDAFGLVNMEVKMNVTEQAMDNDVAGLIPKNMHNLTEKVLEAGYLYDSIKAYLHAISATVYSLYEEELYKQIQKQFHPNMSSLVTAHNITQFLHDNNVTIEELYKGNVSHHYSWLYPLHWYNNWNDPYFNRANASIPFNMSTLVEGLKLPNLERKGMRILHHLLDVNFTGTTGPVGFTGKGDRYPILTVDNIIFRRNVKGVLKKNIFEYDMASMRRNASYDDINNKIWGTVWADGMSGPTPKEKDPTKVRVLHIGCLFQNTSSELTYLQKIAHQALRENIHIVSQHNYSVKFIFKDSGCTEKQAIGMASNLLLRHNVSAIIGPNCNKACESVANIARFYNVPLISYGCKRHAVKDGPNVTVQEPYIRVMPYLMQNLQWIAEVYIDLIYTHLGWYRFVIVYSDVEPWASLTKHMQREFTKIGNENKGNGKRTPVVITYKLQRYTVPELDKQLKDNARIIMFACEDKDVTELLRYFTKEGEDSLLFNEKEEFRYAFFTINYDYANQAGMRDFATRMKKNNKQEDSPKMFGLINMAVKLNVIGRPLKRNITSLIPNDKKNSTEKVLEAGYVYDSIKAYFLAINATSYSCYEEELLKQIPRLLPPNLTYYDDVNGTIRQFLRDIHDKHNVTIEHLFDKKTDNINAWESWEYPDVWYPDPNNKTIASPPLNMTKLVMILRQPYLEDKGKRILQHLLKLNFAGSTGPIRINNQGDRYPILTVSNIIFEKKGRNEKDLQKKINLFEYNTARQILPKKDSIKGLLNIVWADGSKEKPKPNYPEEDVIIRQVLMGVIIPIAAAIFLIIGHRVYQNQKYEGDLMNKNILFKFTELEIPQLKHPVETDFENIQEKPPLSPDGESNSEMTDNLKKKKKKNAQVDVLQGIGTVNIANDVRTFFAKFRYDDVFVKQIPKNQVLVTRDILVELKDIRDLRHPNLNPYEGVCVGPPYVLLISPICKKGTLLDILQTEDIQLNWVFRYTFATDIANGLAALHESPLKYHGHLTSRNVLVDSRWNCKITDYGLEKFKQVLPLRQPSNDAFLETKIYETLLWTAPENVQYPIPKKSKEGDIYSFGIILAEIINRAQGFESFKNYTSRDIVHFIQKRCIPPFRPHVRLQSGLDGRALDLMRACWDEFPENRPTIGELRAKLKTIHNTKTNSKNLLDDMIDMMEKYAHDLEVALNERTQQLAVEKEKSEKANFASLPEPVAEYLEGGNVFAPQTAPAATVMLIKIEDITQYSNTLLPQQIVDLLDDVHRIIEKNCDKYVMEFDYNRDRHYVGCGLMTPTRSHASRVGKAALKIMGNLTTFGFRHIKRDDLKLSIAIHSGDFTVAIQDGRVPSFIVLGKNMKYSEQLLEATPKNRIFITPDALRYLRMDVQPTLEPSGHILVKGVGAIQGHFLTGMKGLNVKLPKT